MCRRVRRGPNSFRRSVKGSTDPPWLATPNTVPERPEQTTAVRAGFSLEPFCCHLTSEVTVPEHLAVTNQNK